jgi:putative signal transducing protein
VKIILESTDRPLVETVRATLEAEGIQVVVQGDAVTALPFITVRVLVGDKDADVARELVRDLVSSSPVASRGSGKRLARLLLVALLIAFIVVCGNLLIG